jgi:hypothetical protein
VRGGRWLYLEGEAKHVFHVVAVIVEELLYTLGQHLMRGAQRERKCA